MKSQYIRFFVIFGLLTLILLRVVIALSVWVDPRELFWFGHVAPLISVDRPDQSGKIEIFHQLPEKIALAGLNAYVKYNDWYNKYTNASSSEINTSELYNEFSNQVPHPYYYSFFPTDGRVLDTINSRVVSVDTRGFRGLGPEAKGSRKLAFFIGGSVAWGDGSSSNETTISGYLNKMQSTYYFVNAAVPAWVTTQEFYRLALELVNYQPDLVLAFDGYSDAHSYFYRSNASLPPGAPWFYTDILKLFKGDLTPSLPAVSQDHMLSLSRKTVDYVNKISMGKADAQNYLHNIELMNNIAKSYNAKFLAILQPSFLQQTHVSADNMNAFGSRDDVKDFITFLGSFHDYIVAAQRPYVVDFSNIFDKAYADIPVYEIFFDHAHLHDKGNEIVAEEIVKELKKQGLLQ